jgi:formylglycine-generating enzyme required for sulfatase activity
VHHFKAIALLLLAALAATAALADDKGALRIHTVPGGAQIAVDGKPAGDSPANPEETFLLRLKPGEHRIRAAKTGFDPVEETVMVAADSERTLDLSLIPELAMAPIPGGCFQMGSPEDEPERDADEGPAHRVCVKPFEIGRHEVTFDDWDACVTDGGCPHRPDDEGWGRGKRPAINISWDDIQDYIRWLNASTGKQFRLPTEAEWEYAARAGTTTPYSSGKCLHTKQANYDGTFPYSDCEVSEDVDLHKTVPVGSYQPNPWGLYDIHGNVNELTQDCWNDGYAGAPTDGTAWLDGNCSRRVIRSGSWYGYAVQLRSAYRCRSGPGLRHRSLGFRLARTLPE